MSEINDSFSKKMAAATFGSGNVFGQSKPGGLGTTTAPGFTFGASTTTTNKPGSAFAFSTPSTSTTSGFTGFGGLSAAKPTTLPGFGQTASTGTGGFNFGQKPATTTASTGLSFSGLQTVTPGTSNLFGAISQPKTAGTSLFLGGSTVTTAPAVGLSSTSTAGGLFGGLTASTVGQATVTGLGGTGTSVTALSGGVSGIAGKQNEIQNLKDNQVPEPLVKVAEDIKNYVKQQKDHRDEIARFSVSNIRKVQEETMALKQSLSVVSNSIQRDACAVENLKMDVAQELKNAEIAQHTSEIPPALQHENIAPQVYFQRLVESFEERMQIYRKQIEIMESHLASLSQGQVITPQDLSLVMHKVHNTFIGLAAQLHGIHEAVKLQKEHYLNYRKAYFKDPTDVFITTNRISTKPSVPVAIGPSPFSTFSTSGLSTTIGAAPKIQTSGLGTSGLSQFNTGNRQLGFGTTSGIGSSFGSGLSTTSFGTPGSSLGSSSTLGTGIGFKGLGTQTGTTSTGFGIGNQTNKPGFGFGTPSNTLLGSTLGTPAATNVQPFGTHTKFELQKPPAGNKRGKKR